MMCYQKQMSLAALAVLMVQTLPFTSCYVTSGLPGPRHRAWLKEMVSTQTKYHENLFNDWRLHSNSHKKFNALHFLCKIWNSQTVDVFDTTPGELSPQMCTATNQILSAWAQNPYVPHTKKHQTEPDTYPHHGLECAILCEKLLKRLLDEKKAGNENAVANTKTYNALIDVWSRSGEKAAAAQRAESIVVGMQDAYSSGQDDVQPDLESFRHVLKAWSQARGDEDAPYHAKRLLDWMVALYDAGENDLLQPDADCFDVVIQSFANSKLVDAPKETENLVIQMDRMYHNGNEKAKPTRLSFNQVLTAWSKSKTPGSAKRSSDILHRMIVLSNHDRDLTPSIASFSAVISAWAKSGDEDCGREAERILQQAEHQYKMQSDNDPYLTPDTILYNLVIDAHARTSSNKAHLRARSVLDRQIKFYNDGNKKCKPDVYTFTSVLSSCATLRGSRQAKAQAFEIAHATFSEMSRSNVIPNHVTYGTMLKACGRLLPPGKDRRHYTREYFKSACKDGCVGDMALRRLKEAASPVQYKALLEGFTKDSLPDDWVRRVTEREKRKKSWKQKSDITAQKSPKNVSRP